MCAALSATAEVLKLRAENVELTDQSVQLTTLLKDGAPRRLAPTLCGS